MTITKVYCDRCGEEVIYPIERRLHLSGIYGEDRYDLCDSCYEELHSWFEMKEIKCDKKEREK